MREAHILNHALAMAAYLPMIMKVLPLSFQKSVPLLFQANKISPLLNDCSELHEKTTQ
jgi:hypothetical protein